MSREIVLDQLGRVPRPPGYELPGGASDADINQFEERTGTSLPSSLREWLKTVNGAMIGPGGTYGICPNDDYLDIETNLGRFPEWTRIGWLPVAGDGTGNYYVAATDASPQPGGSIHFVEAMESVEEPAFIVGSDMWHFLRGLFSRELGEEWWPFDERRTLKADPDLSRYTELTLPWMK